MIELSAVPTSVIRALQVLFSNKAFELPKNIIFLSYSVVEKDELKAGMMMKCFFESFSAPYMVIITTDAYNYYFLWDHEKGLVCAVADLKPHEKGLKFFVKSAGGWIIQR